MAKKSVADSDIINRHLEQYNTKYIIMRSNIIINLILGWHVDICFYLYVSMYINRGQYYYKTHVYESKIQRMCMCSFVALKQAPNMERKTKNLDPNKSRNWRDKNLVIRVLDTVFGDSYPYTYMHIYTHS